MKSWPTRMTHQDLLTNSVGSIGGKSWPYFVCCNVSALVMLLSYEDKRLAQH